MPIWRSEDGEEKCIGSAEDLYNECEAAVKAGLMAKNPLADFKGGDMSEANYQTFDPHRPYADDIVLVSSTGKPMKRETDLIDVWFDSGAMPCAQLHYPFENKEMVDGKTYFPADFIAEGVDQTRGWFYTLHTIATLCFDSVAYKNVGVERVGARQARAEDEQTPRQWRGSVSPQPRTNTVPTPPVGTCSPMPHLGTT